MPRSRSKSARPAATPSDPAARPLATDVQAFGRFVRLIYEGALDASAWRAFLRILTDELGGNSAVIILRIPQLGDVPLKVAVGEIKSLENSYYHHYMAMDPFVQLPEGQAVTMHDFVDDPDELEQSLYFREWLVPQDMVYALGVDLRDRGRYHVRLRICRPRRAGNFTPEDCRFVETLVPHLRTAIRVFSELDLVRSERSHYADAMDQLTLATLVLDEHARILHANRLAEAILAERDGLTRSGDTLAIAHREDAKRFRELLARAVEVQHRAQPGLVDVMRVRRESGRPDIGLVVRPSSSSIDEHNRRLTTSIAVFLSTDVPAMRAEAVPCQVIQQLFGLTQKEATLALRLAAGESLQQASRGIGISPNTGRAHLRSIFTKTGVDRQAQLVRVLLKSVAMLGTP